MRISKEEYSRRKDRILRAAFHLFCRDGIEPTTISSIAQEAQVSENSVYRYFQTKVDLVEQTYAILWQGPVHNMEQSLLHNDEYLNETGYEQVSHLLSSYFDIYRERLENVHFSFDCKLYFIRSGVHANLTFYQRVFSNLRQLYEAALNRGRTDRSICGSVKNEDFFGMLDTLVSGLMVTALYSEILPEMNESIQENYRLSCQLLLCFLKTGWPQLQPAS